MNDEVKKLAAIIEHMTSLARKHAATHCELGWWVVLCGGALEPDDFDQRERMRERLVELVRELGIALQEHVWVWDELNQAQLVVGRFPSYEQAMDKAELLSERIKNVCDGVAVRVMQELEEGRG
ncbi:MAG: hypothetical protein R6W92_14095 [Desulfocurvibacter africanus]